MKHIAQPVPRRAQRGVAALIISLVLLFGMTIVVFFLNRGLLFEQKSSANQFRATSAFELAEAGVEWATGMLNDQRYITSTCTVDTSTTTPKTSFRERYLTPSLTADTPPLIQFTVPAGAIAGCRFTGGQFQCSCPKPGTETLALAASTDPSFTLQFAAVPGDTEAIAITATGCINQSADCLSTTPDAQRGDATATVRTVLKLKPTLRAAPSAALSAGGAVSICGSFNMTNKDMNSNGNLVNAGGHIEIGNLIETGETGLGGCGGGGGQTLSTIPGTPIENVLVSGDSSLDSLSSNPDGMFSAYFGTTLAQYQAQATLVTGGSASERASNLIALYNQGYTDFWIDGDIHFSGSGTLGSANRSVKIVSSSDIKVNGTMNIYGLIYSSNSEWNALGTGASNIHGAVVTLDNYKNNGNGTITYDPAVLFGGGRLSGPMLRVPGSWRDF